MEYIRKSSGQAKDAILGKSTAQSGTEPPSGATGEGPQDQPSNQDNAPEATTQSQEPVSVETGKGTTDEPFDKGNEGEAAASSAPNSSSAAETTTTSTAPSPPTETPNITSRDSTSNGTPLRPKESNAGTPTMIGNISLGGKQQKVQPTSLASDNNNTTTTTTTNTLAIKEETIDKDLLKRPTEEEVAEKRAEQGRGRNLQVNNTKVFDRDVSPGTLDDGTHAVTSGDRGESYKVPHGLGKLASKFGKH